MDLIDDELELIKYCCDQATPGPWIWRSGEGLVNKYIDHGLVISLTDAEISRIRMPDLRFIEDSRTDIPKLLSEIDRLKSELQHGPRIISPHPDTRVLGLTFDQIQRLKTFYLAQTGKDPERT